MAAEITGPQRRDTILSMLRETSQPLSGSALGKNLGVSRQVVVQDMALLRTEGYPIISTPRGYCLEGADEAVRLIKVYHTNQQVEDELTTIVDLGGRVLDVMVYHRTYGKVSAPLKIRNRRDIKIFIGELKSGKSVPLLNVTSGYHYHHVAADYEEILDEIQEALESKHYLAEYLPHELESLQSR